MSEIPLAWRRKIRRPYGKGTIIIIALYATWNLFANLASIPDAQAVGQAIEEAATSAGPALGPEASLTITFWRSFVVFYAIDILVWFVIVILQYALVYGLSKPRKWARKAGTTSLKLALIMSVAWLLASIAFARSVGAAVPSSAVGVLVWNTVAFFAGRRFLNKPEVRNYVESEGYEKRIPFMIEEEAGKTMPFMVEQETMAKPAPPEKAEVEPVEVKPVEEPVEELVEKPVEEVERKHCRYCGARIPADSVFCEGCGKKLT